MKITEIRHQLTPGWVLVVLPIAAIFESDAECEEQIWNKKFRFESELSDLGRAGDYLVHARSLAGESVNKVFVWGK